MTLPTLRLIGDDSFLFFSFFVCFDSNLGTVVGELFNFLVESILISHLCDLRNNCLWI